MAKNINIYAHYADMYRKSQKVYTYSGVVKPPLEDVASNEFCGFLHYTV
jgi:hypothetical protein